ARINQSDGDPFTDADTLARAVEIGLLDAPHVRGNQAGCGTIVTRMINGACLAVEGAAGKPIFETQRVKRILGLNHVGKRESAGAQVPGALSRATALPPRKSRDFPLTAEANRGMSPP